MFTWICEKCGGEVLPSQDQCPRCNPPQPAAQPAAPASEAVVPAPQPVAPQPVAPTPQPVAPAPQPAPQTYAPQPHYYDAPPEPKSTTLRDVLVTLMVAGVIMGGGYFFWMRGERTEKAESKATEMEAVKGPKSTHPLAKQIEVTGIRLRMPKAGQAEVQALVVNHSAAEIAGMGIDVALFAKGTNKEIAVFPLKVKSLSPFGSVELSAKTKTEVSAIDLPDWQFLEARVVIQAGEQ